jgi:hypothetical protein
VNPSNEFVRALDLAIPLEPSQRSKTDNYHFCYRAAIGELIWPMITTHPELSYPVVKLIQFASRPASIQYDAMFGILQYLSSMRDDGLTYDPIAKHTPLRPTPPDRFGEHILKEGPMTLFGYIDSDWAMDIRHHRFISGMVFCLTGAVVAWKTRVHVCLHVPIK